MTARSARQLTLALGVASASATVLALLALLDIYHGEPDVRLEWNIVRISLVLSLIFHACALRLFWKTLPAGNGSDPSA